MFDLLWGLTNEKRSSEPRKGLWMPSVCGLVREYRMISGLLQCVAAYCYNDPLWNH